MTRMRYFASLALAPLWCVLAWIIPKRDDYLVVGTFPDFDDTTRSFASEALRTRKRLHVLTFGRHRSRPDWLRHPNIRVACRNSLHGVWMYQRSRYVFFTHGLFSTWRPSRHQVVTNVWHGMPIKRIGLLLGDRDARIPRFHYTIASPAVFRPIIAQAFGVRETQVLECLHPRLDQMLRSGARSALSLPANARLAFWLPTYRQSHRGDLRRDGDAGMDVFSPTAELGEIDAVFRRANCICLMKPHPMAHASPEVLKKYTNLRYIDDVAMEERGCSLYSILGECDLLITDISSIYFDFASAGGAAVLYCPDLREYERSRGFVAPITTIVPDPIHEAERDFICAVQRALSKPRRAKLAVGGATRDLLKQVGALAE